ncbi:MAG: DUF92 domain-containing protein [Bacteroidota bacterium]
MNDLQATGLFAVLLLASVALGEAIRVFTRWQPESTRRVVHMGVGLTTAASPLWFDAPAGIYVLAVLFVAGNVVAILRGWFPGMHATQRRTWGTALFPLALIVALWLCWTLDASRIYVMQATFLVLGLADPAASFVGTRLRSPRRYRVGAATKSLEGTVAFACVAFACTLLAVVVLGPDRPLAESAAAAAVVAMLAATAEALGKAGWDNLWIVLAVVVPLSHLDATPGALVLHLYGVAAAVVFVVATFRAHALDLSGALAGGLLAWMLVALGGMRWAVPALVFFVLSSVLSKVGRRSKAEAESKAEKGSRRDAGQVVANGGVAACALAATVFDASPLWYVVFVGAFAAAAADTWATEVGTARRGTTRLLAVGPVVAPGTSGGMSLSGTAGAVAGAASVVLAAALVASASGVLWVLVGAVGVAASVVDSALGASIQARYRHPNGSLTERSEVGGQALPLAAGWRAIGNDAVNMTGTMVGGAGAALVAAALL